MKVNIDLKNWKKAMSEKKLTWWLVSRVYIDGVLSPNNFMIGDYVNRIYHIEPNS
jgi:hypothetical protein